MTKPNSSDAGRRSGTRGRSSSRPAKKPRAAVEPLHPTSTPPDVEDFRDWDFTPEIQEAIAAMGITKPTPIQALAIPPGLKRKDIIAQAETGTGKTLAFGVPMMSLIDPSRVSVLGLVLCPTRELAEQVAEVLRALGKPRDLSVALIVGGEPTGPQVKALKEGSQVVVGTPGRVLDLYQQGFLSFPWTEFVVLDEADEMLEIGFIDDVKKILSFTPDERTTLLFSATFPPDLLRLAREYTTDPAEIATASGVATVDNITQEYCLVDERERPLALIRMIEQSKKEDVFLVFCERRTDVERLMRRMEREHFSVKALHGGYDQPSRFRVMSAFRTGEVKCLVATDVASRGLDVKHVTHVVNYGPPRSITQYTHRIGRTGRAGRDGHAITIVSGDEGMRKWRFVQREATWEIPEVPSPGRYAQRREERPRREAEGRDRGGREERPRREAGGRERGGREERPRREAEGRDRKPREEQPRREREERPRREREERPKREASNARAAKADDSFGSFGAAVHDSAPQADPKPERKKERKAPSEPKPERREKPQRDNSTPPPADGGFGAGI